MMLFFPKHRDFTIQPPGISAVETITVGGVQQSILIQAENPENPVLLFVHGGPSMPLPGVGCRSADYALAVSTKELVKHFVVVFWDQRGTGKSYHKDIPEESIHLGQHVSDANEVTDYLRDRFHQDKIYLVAHSWGTTIALYLVSKYPDKFHAYTALSQITSWTRNDKLGYEWVLEHAKTENNQKAIKELTGVGGPPYVKSFKQWSVLRKWLMKYHSMFYDTGDANSPTFLKGLKIMLKSPDYSLQDVFHTLVSGFKMSYTQRLIEDLATADFFSDVPRVGVPVYFIHGRQETHVFPELAVAYFEQLDAPQGKQFYWLEKSAHMYHPDDAKEVERILISTVLNKQNERAG